MIRDHRSRGDGPKRRDGRQDGTKGDRLTSRVGVLLVAMSFLVAACGSRESGPPAVGAEGSGAAAPTTTSSDRVGDNGKVGTLEPACGSGNPAHGATARGVTDTTITIGVISDKSGVVAVPTAGIDGSVDAFVQFCNSLGGINGRRLVLKHYDSKILNEGDAMKQACDDDIFALVGSGSVQDDQGAVAMVQCELVEVAGVHRNVRQRTVAAGVLAGAQSGHRVCGRSREVHRQAVPRGSEEGGDHVAELAGRAHTGRASARRI